MEIDALHRDLIEQFGGSHGTRDDGMIESALSRPINRWSYEPSCDLADLAASYGYGLTKNHGYVDGNKRIGFAAAGVFLMINGLMLDVPEPEAIIVMLEVAAGDRDETTFAEWIREHTVPFDEL
jgi:death on curing protein